MNGLSVNTSERVAEARRAFDASFAAPPQSGMEEVEDLLCFRIRGDGYAFRIGDIAGVTLAGRVVPLPSPALELLGIAGHRGSLVPVYSLAGILGYGAGRETPRWLILVGGRDPVGLAVEELEGFRRVPRRDLHGPGQGPGKHVDQFARSGPIVRGILRLDSVMAAVRAGVAPARAGGLL
jgi:chemotaxis signal transduction protein